MAQETAGTIGIPVLRNEVLPYLTDYAKRRERAELYKQKAEQRAAELAAKKAAEDAKYVPKYEPGLGSDMWEHVDRAKNEADIQQGLALAKDQTVPRQQVMSASNEINRRVSQRSNISKQLKENTLKTAEDLKNRYRKVGPEYAYQCARQEQDYKSPEEFAKDVRSNPDLIDFDAIGKKAKDYRQQQYSYRGPGGKTVQIGISPLFEYKMETDPVVGTEVPVVTGINGVEAQKLIESDQDMKEAFDVFVRNRAEANKSKTYIDPQTGSPIMLRPEIAEQKAAEEFMNNAFGKYGKVKYGQSFQMPRRAGGGSEKPPISISTKSPGVRSVEFKVTPYNLPKGTKPPVQQALIGSPSDVEHTYSKPYAFNANVPVFFLQNPDDVSATGETIGKYFGERPDGSYTLKSGFEYQSPVESTVYFADKDIRFYGKTGKVEDSYVVKKGTPLDNETALNLIRQKKSDFVKKRKGYEVTATMNVPLENDRRGTVTEVRRPVVKIFIPEGNAATIKKHIDMEKRKVNAFEASPSKEAGEFTYFSNP